MAGLVPAIPTREHSAKFSRDHRDKPGDDNFEFNGETKGGIIGPAFFSPENVIAPYDALPIPRQQAFLALRAALQHAPYRRRDVAGRQRAGSRIASESEQEPGGIWFHGRYPLSDFGRRGIGNTYGGPLNAAV